MGFLSIFTGLFSGMKMKIIMWAAIFAVVAGAAFYFYYSQNRIASLNKENATMEMTIKTQEETITTLLAGLARSQKLLDEMNQQFEKIEQETGAVSKVFGRHHLEELARNKPKLIERIINKGTKELLEELEEITKIIKEDTVEEGN